MKAVSRQDGLGPADQGVPWISSSPGLHAPPPPSPNGPGLTAQAYDHARAAASATHTADTTVAIAEHALAAGEFANAAQNTQSTEGLRTLHLLEQHHKRLSELLKQPLDTPSQQSAADSDLGDEDEKDGQGQDGDVKGTKSPTPESTAAAVAAAAAASSTSNKSLPTLPQQRRYQGRELSSSIASNLASARGIKASKYRGQPVAPSVSNDQAPGSLEARPRRGKGDGTDHSRKPSWIPPTQDDIKEDEPTGEASGSSRATAAPAEDGFSRFYSTFGSLINRLSAPLAFSGLPLVPENPAAESATLPPPEPSPPRRTRVKTSTSAEPELSRIYSRATLRALARDGGGGDSFYVVPPSGHTATYASILNHESKERRRTAASREDADFLDDQDDDDFVDAREVQHHHSAAPSSSLLSGGGFRKRLGKARSEREMQVTIEELHTENASLKEMLDKLSKRLHAFELGSQSTHLALAQSIRLHRPGSPMSASTSGGVGPPPVPGPADEALRRRNRELEEQVGGMGARVAGLQQEIEKLNETLDKYREQWEKLKAGAKARREAKGSSGEAGSGRGREG